MSRKDVSTMSGAEAAAAFSTSPTNPEPATVDWTWRADEIRKADGNHDLGAAAARAEALAPERLTAAIMAAVGASHPDDFGIRYREGRGFSPAGLAVAILALLPPSAEDRHG